MTEFKKDPKSWLEIHEQSLTSWEEEWQGSSKLSGEVSRGTRMKIRKRADHGHMG